MGKYQKTGQPCPKCGGSDSVGIHHDGSGYCFSNCGYISQNYLLDNQPIWESDLTGVPVEINVGGNISTLSYDIAADNGGFINLDGPLNEVDTNMFENEAAVKMYISGPTNDPVNADLGNYWYKRDSFPVKSGVTYENYYLHRD